VELGPALHRHRQDRPGREVHRQPVQRQLPGRAADRAEPVRPVAVRTVGRRRHQAADRHRADRPGGHGSGGRTRPPCEAETGGP
jgi:hypothetical protein